MKVEYIIIHCSATPPKMDIGRKEIDRWHRQKGWLKIGYHFVIRRNGTVEKGRDLSEAGAHAVGYNDRSLGICLIGGVNDQMKAEANFTQAQWSALIRLLKELKALYPDAKIIGHNEVASKSCPSFNVQEWLKTVAI